MLANLWREIRAGDLLIVPSTFEGDGLVVVEAFAYGIPLLFSDIPNFRRFDFPNIHYCETSKDFILCIKKNLHHIQIFDIEESARKRILEPREINPIALRWKSLFSQVLSVHEAIPDRN